MRLIVLLLFLFLSLSYKAQYRLDFGFGYDKPLYILMPRDGSDRYFDPQFNGFQGHIGIERKLTSELRHSYGLGYLQRVLKNKGISDYVPETTNQYSLTINELQAFYQLTYLPYKRKRLGFSIAFSGVRELYKTNKISGVLKPFYNDYKYFDATIYLGLAYELPISKKLNLIGSAGVSKSLFQFRFQNYAPDPSYYNVNFDARIKLGLTYDLSDSLILNLKQRKVRRQKENRITRLLTQSEIRTFFYSESRLFKMVEEIYLPQGYSSTGVYFSPEKTTHYGVGLGISHSRNRWTFTGDLIFERKMEELNVLKATSYHHPHAPTWAGPIVDYYKETDTYHYINNRLRISGGVGFKLFHPKSKFNIIPNIRFSSGFSLSNNVSQNYYKKERKRYWALSSTPYWNYEWDSTFYPSRISIAKRNNDFLIGATFTLNFWKKLSLFADLHYATKSSNVISTPYIEYGYDERLRKTFSIGLSYKFHGKEKIKDPLPPVDTKYFDVDYYKERNKRLSKTKNS